METSTETTFETTSVHPTTSKLEFIFQEIYLLMTGIMACLSIIGATITILTFLLVPDLKRKRYHLIVFLSIADGLTAFGNLLGVIWVATDKSLGDPYCVFHSALTNYSSASSYMWNVSISVYLYLVLVHNQQSLADRLKPLYHSICWILPVCIVGVALGFGALGPDVRTHHPSWCWIRSDVPQFPFQMFCAKGWELAAYACIIVFYGLIIVYLTKKKRDISRSMKLAGSHPPRRSAFEMISDANRKLIFVPVAFFLLRIWGTVRFLVNTFDSGRTLGNSTIWLAPIQGLGDSGQGFANFVLYCLLPGTIRRHICRRCRNTSGTVTPTPGVTSEGMPPVASS